MDTGTFITRDPLGFVDGPNMYAYVVQNPWTMFDPEGLAKRDSRTPSNDEIQDRVSEIKGQRAAIQDYSENIKGNKDLKDYRKELEKTAKSLEEEQKMLTKVLEVREKIGENGYSEWTTGREISSAFGSDSKEIADVFFAPEGGFAASNTDRSNLQTTAGMAETSLNVSSLGIGGPMRVAGGAMATGVKGAEAAWDWKAFSRFFYDSRKYKSVSRQYWAARGGAGDMSLHHWMFPQRWEFVPQGFRNAGFNLMEVPRGFNSWMGYSTVGRGVETGVRLGVPASVGGAAYGGAKIGDAVFNDE